MTGERGYMQRPKLRLLEDVSQMPPIGRVPLFLHLVGINSHFLLGHSVAVTTA